MDPMRQPPFPAEEPTASHARLPGAFSGAEAVGKKLLPGDPPAPPFNANDFLSLHSKILETIPESVVLTDEAGMILYTNRASADLFGYAPGEQAGKHVSILSDLPPKENARFVDRILAHLKEKGFWEGALRNVRKDGAFFTCHGRISALEWNGGKYWVWVQEDIGGRKRTEERMALKLADTKRLHDLGVRLLSGTELASLLHEVLVASLDLTGADKGNVQLYDESEGALKIVAHEGFTPEFLEEFRSVPAGYSVCGESMARRERVVVDDALRDLRFSKFASLYAKHGFAAVQSTPLIGGGGAFLGMISTHFAKPHRPSRRELQLLDLFAQQAVRVIERKRAEEISRRLFDLVASVNRARALSEIYDAALDAICHCHGASRASVLLLDADGVMRFKAWRGLSESYRCAVEGHSPWTPGEADPQPICVDNVAQMELEPCLSAVIAREGIVSLAFIPIANDKRLLGKFMIYYNLPHAFTAGEIGLARTIASQIAFAIERHESGEALERLVHERTVRLRETIGELEAFSYSIAHDMRAPLRAMQSFCQLLNEDCAEQVTDEGRDYLRRITTAAGRMDRLIQDLLIYSRVSRSEVAIVPVDLDLLVQGVLEACPELQSKHLVISLERPLPWVMGNEASLTQCFSNLLGNAAKFVAPGAVPKATIRAERRGQRVRVWIEDNGIGIPADQHERIFGIFERLHKGYEGTGIGLAIVRKAVERMGGSLGLESEPGKGSRFWFELPRAGES